MAKRHRLKKVRLTEISLVDTPAAEGAMIMVFKRGKPPTTTEGSMTSAPDMAKMLEDMAKATESIEALTKRAEEAEARAVAAEEKASAVAKAAGEAGSEEDPILKAADPIVAAEIIKLRKSNAAAAKQLADAAEEGEIAKAKDIIDSELSALPVKSADFAPVFKRAMSVLDEEDATEIRRLLKAGNAAIEAEMTSLGYSGIMKQSSAEQELDAKAKEIAAATSVSFEKAYVRATEVHPDLYRQFLAERGESN